MRVLVACEYSGVVRDAFIAKGHDAISCDLLPTDAPGPHIMGDCIPVICRGGWDLIIMHPPCTALTVAGNSTYGEGKPRYSERLQAAQWTSVLWHLAVNNSKAVVMENPVGVLRRLGGLPKPQYVQPYMFGHLEQKKTGLWLHNLPELKETNNVYDEMMKLPKRERERLHYLPPSADRWKIRSTTFTGIAQAMAEQWGDTA
jgi:hypothetical protein